MSVEVVLRCDSCGGIASPSANPLRVTLTVGLKLSVEKDGSGFRASEARGREL